MKKALTSFILLLSASLFSQSKHSFLVDLGITKQNLDSHYSFSGVGKYRKTLVENDLPEFNLGVGYGNRINNNLSFKMGLCYSFSYFEYKDLRKLYGFIKQDLYYENSLKHNLLVEFSTNWKSGSHKKRSSRVGFYGEVGVGVGYNWVVTNAYRQDMDSSGIIWVPRSYTIENDSPYNFQGRIELGGYLNLSNKKGSVSLIKVGVPFYIRKFFQPTHSTKTFYQFGFIKVGYEFL